MTRADRIAVVVLACAALLATPIAAAREHRSSSGNDVVVQGPEGTRRLPLDADGSCTVRGLRGRVVVAVSSGSVRVVESSCHDQVCVHAGSISRPGQAIACIPNGVIVTVEGEERELDAVVR
ncbi:MAG: NusG domain II-containing protein [Anaerosomatales bacterium]|nr:NusG domain II-containing protein [Anaerosomatales bacterium]